jgi:hypothetical protein
MPPARLLMTAVVTASSKSFAPDAPPELIRPMLAHVAVGDLVAAVRSMGWSVVSLS